MKTLLGRARDDLGVASDCIFRLLKTKGEDDDTAPAQVGAVLLAQLCLSSKYLPYLERLNRL